MFNGFNLFAYMGLNPVNGTDPFGLSWDDDVDDQISDLTGHKLYALGQLNEGAKWASLGLQTALGIATSLLPGAGLYDAFHSMGAIISGRGGFWDAVAVVAVVVPAAKGIMALRAYYKARKFQRAARAARSIDPNKLHHIFGNPRHKLDGLVDKLGSQEEAYHAIVDATEATVEAQKITGTFTTVVKVGGEAVEVRGIVVDGVVKVGTAYIP